MTKKLIIPLFLASWLVQAQTTHTVAEKETPYSISRKYKLSLQELYQLNPEIQNEALKIGQVIRVSKSAQTLATTKTGKIILQPKQTLYGITKQYHITEAELRRLNPNLEMKIGEEVVLPLDKINQYADPNAFVNIGTGSNTEAKTEPTPAEAAKKTLAQDEYEVQPRDNYYKISRKFKISQKDLFALNPGLEQSGLKVGAIIKIKHTQHQPESINTVPAQEDYVTYTVQAGDTVFGILNRFNIDLEDLESLNPQISSGLRAGMILKIKKLSTAYIKKNQDALSVVLMLPFGFETGDTKYRTLSTDFLAGAKLAIEMNAAKGQALDIKIIDAGSETAFKNNLIQINKENTDLIIGPLFKSNVIEVLDYVKDHKIPVVAPFANSPEMYDYGNLIITETDQHIYADRIVTEVTEVYDSQPIYIVSGKDKGYAEYIQTQLKKKLKKANLQVVESPSEVQLEKNMLTGQYTPAILILATEASAVGQNFASKIIELAKETEGIKAFSMFYTPAFDRNVEELGKASLVYLIDRKINTEGAFEQEVLAAYTNKYCKTPSKYAVIGFDVVNDMLSRENKRGEIFKQINKAQTQLATKFEFQRVKSGGAYVNMGYRIVRLFP